jgi:anti-sigma B factor antagonist
MSSPHCPVQWAGSSALVTLPAEIDISVAGVVGEDLQAVLWRGARSVFVDMSTTTFCDCAGVTALIGAYLLAQECNAEFRLVARAPAVLRILALTGVGRLFDVHPTLSSAMACEPGADTAPRFPGSVRPLADAPPAEDPPAQDPPAQVPQAPTPFLSRRRVRRPVAPPGQTPATGGGCGGSPLTSVTISLASSRSLTLRRWDASRSTPNASDWVHRFCPMITPSAWSMTARLTSEVRSWSTSEV